ncbi:MAG: hypothetical protein M3X11_20830 [Acidobacteriota bacterium]|nr:hypothetical protein [Acidobacteriota bacterium]
MVFLGFTCVFLGIVIAIMVIMAIGARGIAKDKQKEAEAAAAIEDKEDAK